MHPPRLLLRSSMVIGWNQETADQLKLAPLTESTMAEEMRVQRTSEVCPSSNVHVGLHK